MYVQYMINTQTGHTPLHRACLQGHTKAVTTLLSVKETNRNIQDKTGQTPLHAAAAQGHSRIVKILLLNGADASIVTNVIISNN